MVQEIITSKSGKVNDFIHHIDLKEFGIRRKLSSFIAEFDDWTIFLDIGSSLNVPTALRYAKKNKIPLSSVKYLITSHHHFDHTGGI